MRLIVSPVLPGLLRLLAPGGAWWFPVTFDVGVVELDEDAPVTTFGELAPLGTAEELAGDTGQGRNEALDENSPA